MNKNTFLLLILLFPLLLFSQLVQWRGPNRDGHFSEAGLMKTWPTEGPKLVLEIEKIGKGWSSPVVYEGKIYVTGMIDTLDYLSCINSDGTIGWQIPYGRSWNQTFPDTRATPTLLDKKAYLSTGMGVVVCIDLSSQKVLWNNDAFGNNGGEVGTWGISESILLVDNKAIFTTGGKQTHMVAIDIATGKEIWKTQTLNDALAYVSPILVEQNGKKQIVSLTAKYLFGVNPDNGEIVWNFNFFELDDSEWDNSGGVINCTSPIYHNGYLYISSGYNHTGAKFKMKEDLSGVEFLWKDKQLDNHHGGVILFDGVVYGSNWLSNNRGNWCAIDFETGEKLYEETFRNKGSIVAADGMLYIYTEQPGYVALVKPNREKFDLVSQFRIDKGNGPHWAHPSIHDGVLYIRHGEVLMGYDIKNH